MSIFQVPVEHTVFVLAVISNILGRGGPGKPLVQRQEGV
jgi:hypothetical protein